MYIVSYKVKNTVSNPYYTKGSAIEPETYEELQTVYLEFHTDEDLAKFIETTQYTNITYYDARKIQPKILKTIVLATD